MRLNLNILSNVFGKTFKLWCWKTHTWTGLFSGIFLLIICVSGSIVVFKPEIERAFDWNGYDFVVKPVGTPVTAEEVLKVLREAYPGRSIGSLVLPADTSSGDSNLGVYQARIGGGKGEKSLDVLVDPYQAKVVAETRLQEGWGYWLRQLHLRLLYGQFWGRWIVGVFGIVLVYSTISGLIIYAKFNANSWKPMLRRGRGSRIFLADLHKIVGVGSLAFNLLFGATGAVLGLETLYARYASKPATERPTTKPAAIAETKKPTTAPSAEMKPKAPAFKAPPGAIDACVAEAARLFPDQRVSSLELSGLATGTLRMRMQAPTAALVKEGVSSVTFDLRTLEPRKVDDARTHSAAARVYYSMEPLHFGRLGGSMIVKLLWAVMGLSGGLLSITGYVIYVARWRKKRATRRALAPAVEPHTPQTAPATA